MKSTLALSVSAQSARLNPAKVIVELTPRQLDVLLDMIESSFSVTGERRGLKALKKAVEASPDRWFTDLDFAEKDLAFGVAAIAPVYRQLLTHWPKRAKSCADAHDTTDADFNAAMTAAKACIAA